MSFFSNFSNNSLSEIQNVHDLNELTDFIAGLLPTTKENKIFYMEELNALWNGENTIQLFEYTIIFEII